MSEDNPGCQICYGDYEIHGPKTPLVLPCGHTFCKECIYRLEDGFCAVCRNEFYTEDCVTNYYLLDLIEKYSSDVPFSVNKDNIKIISEISELKQNLCKEVVRLQTNSDDRLELVNKEEFIIRVHKVQIQNNSALKDKYNSEFQLLDKEMTKTNTDDEQRDVSKKIAKLNKQIAKIGDKNKIINNIIDNISGTRIIQQGKCFKVTHFDDYSVHLHCGTKCTCTHRTVLDIQLRSLWFDPYPILMIAFFSFSINDKPIGRVYVEVETGRPCALGFLTMCIGERDIYFTDNQVSKNDTNCIKLWSTENNNFKNTLKLNLPQANTSSYEGNVYFVQDSSTDKFSFCMCVDQKDKDQMIGKIIIGKSIIEDISKRCSDQDVFIHDTGVLIQC